MRIGVVCPDLRRHLGSTLVLARELARRGHDLTLLAPPAAGPAADRDGIPWRPIGAKETADGSLAALWAEAADRATVRATARAFAALARMHLRDLPAAIDGAGLAGLLVDESCPAAAVVAEGRRLPYVVTCPTIFGSASDDAPPPATALRIGHGRLARWKNRLAGLVMRRAAHEAADAPHGVRPLDLLLAPDRGLARLTPMPEFLDVPRRVRATRLHRTGPWRRAPAGTAPPTPPGPGGPTVLVEVGTPSSDATAAVAALERASRGLASARILRRDPDGTEPTPGDEAGLPRATADEPLSTAAALVTDGDLDSVLEALALGVPLLCVPASHDQPGVARRVERHGSGLVVPAASATPEKLRAALRRLLEEPSFRERAAAARRALAGVQGARRAADVAERALATGRPVTAPGAAQAI